MDIISSCVSPVGSPAGLRSLVGILPGVLLCAALTLAANLLQDFEAQWLGRAWLEALVLAILLGTAVRTAWAPGPRWSAGIQFSAKFLLELAVVLLGATVSARMVLGNGWGFVLGIAAVVFLAIAVSYGLGRLFGLPPRMATLIACGNSICGNSAIAAVAPVIGAHGDDVAASIAFTAVLGVGVVLGLPVLAVLLGWSARTFGVFAGLTVYAVPQVLAATAPISSVSAQVGTLVKLVRVLMLGPVVLALSLLTRAGGGPDKMGTPGPAGRAARLEQLVPWFIVGFLLMVGARSAGFVPLAAAHALARVSGVLTVMSMAALGLGVDIRVVAKAGPRVTAVVVLSLLALGAISYALICLLGVV
ncbi:MAG: putative sulfate exporter family transporter [Burkholderiaceae bacterium]|nr:putative sulfate exporter family transporter [Burkholderiaceae bacterium]